MMIMMLVVEVILVVIMNQVKDVRVPAQLMRAMAAEAEAAREARAKVVLFMTIKIRGTLTLNLRPISKEG